MCEGGMETREGGEVIKICRNPYQARIGAHAE
jgi:hypothetical protein